MVVMKFVQSCERVAESRDLWARFESQVIVGWEG